MQITKNFNTDEFECTCGCNMPNDVKDNIVKLAIQLQTIRNHIKKPIHINSGYRCAYWNNIINGVPSSQHILGKAGDIRVIGLAPKKLSEQIERLIEAGDILQGGVGVYNNFVHYDIRRYKARWDYRG